MQTLFPKKHRSWASLDRRTFLALALWSVAGHQPANAQQGGWCPQPGGAAQPPTTSSAQPQTATRRVPPMDLEIPADIQTATFALG